MAKLGASSPERDQEMDARYREAFQSEAGRKKRKKGIKAFFCITLVLSVLVSLLNWGIITGWGNVKVERLTLSGYNGDRISALLYIPKNATSETPAPLVFNCHGNAGNGRNHESWAVEFARRGFVVLSVDLYGSGDSENSAESFASMAMLTSVTDTFYEHMLNRDYVDKDNILIGAHSMGGSVAAGLAGKYQPKGVMSASGALGGQFNGVEGAEERVEMIGTYVGDVLLDFGDVERDEASLCSLVQDWLDSRVGYDGYEGVEYTQVGQIVGSFEEGNAVVGLLDTNRVHEAAFVNQETIGNLIWFAQEAVGDAVPNYIDPGDQVWMYKDYVGLAGIFIFGLFICALALLLIETVPFFEDVKRVRARNIGLRKGGLVISIVLGLIFPYIVLKTNGLGLISAIGMTSMPPTCVGLPGFRLTYSNMAFCTLIGLNLLGLLGFALYYFTEGKRHKLTLNDLGLTPGDSNRLSGKMIGKTVLLSALVVAIAWALLALQEETLGTTFYAWFFGFKSIYLPKVQYYVWYILIWILCFVVASFSINVERRLPTTGNETLDTVIAMVFNVVMASFTLVLVIAVDWILSSYGVKERSWLFTFGTDITRLWGMPAGMAVGVAGSTLLYRKTGNTWLSAILMGTVAALMCATYGQVRIFS